MLPENWLTTLLLILPLGMSLVEGTCEGLGFPLPCDVPLVEYNEAIAKLSGDELCVTGDGKIYLLSGCETTLEYQVPGSPVLNGIDGHVVYIVVGESGTVVRGFGTIWEVLSSPTTQDLWDVYFSGGLDGYAVGNSGTIIKSTDYGETWSLLPSPTTANLYSVECGEHGTVSIYGEDLTGYKSFDGGTTWIEMDFYGVLASHQLFESGPPDLYTSFFLDDSTGYAFGEFGVAFKTTDGGSTWQPGFVPGFNRINTAYFSSVDSGVVAGDNGVIRITTDGGLSWFEDSLASSLTTQNINAISVISDSLGVIVGDSGTVIFVATDSTLLDVRNGEEVVPTNFSLEQNYPNPFNPRTTIEFAIRQLSFVNLKIYDILGREVATLVNETKRAGTYEVTWEASDYASGVYYYRLTAHGSNTQVARNATRKMVIAK